MMDTSIYQDIAVRTDGNLYIGVVGPVRTGKSTFIKRFMETVVLPLMDDTYAMERARDELPQCGSGRMVMTAEPKFVPESAAQLQLENGMRCAVRMIDSVGYMVQGASGNLEDGAERMVMTPWYAHEIPMSQAAAEGTRRVISDHSTVSVMVTTDGSVCALSREDYIPAEEQTVKELLNAGKPFVIILNCREPASEAAHSMAAELAERYGHPCMPLNCQTMEAEEIIGIIRVLLTDFPVSQYRVFFPPWMEALGEESAFRSALFTALRSGAEEAVRIGDVEGFVDTLRANESIEDAKITSCDLATGIVSVRIELPRRIYYEIISRESGFPVRNDRDLMLLLQSVGGLKEEYERVHEALESARSTGYGIVMPTMEEMRLEEPQIVRQGGRYGVRLKASAPSVHMILANIETEVSPAIGGEKASEEVINFLLQGYDGDVSRIWESNIFGKPLNDIAGEGLNNKIRAMPQDAQGKLRATIQKIVNEGSGGLICILL